MLQADETLGGDGTPQVAAFTPEALAVAIGGRTGGGRNLIGRRPRPAPPPPPAVETRPNAAEVPAWQARRVARQTHRLPYAGARWVDDQLAARTGCGPVIVDRLVAQAIAQFDPEDQRTPRRTTPQPGWDVTLTHPDPTDFAGTSDLTPTATPRP